VQEASRLKSEILANAHHELQTPLGAILGYAEMIEMGYFGEISEAQKEVLHKIIGRTNHLTALIQDLLAQANLEARKIGANQTVVLPEEMLRDIHQKMNAQAAAKGLTLTSEIAADFPGLLISDPKRLQKILTNLVGNGIKFTEAGNVHIRLYQPESTSWAMAVSDTGPGIPEAAQSYIFEPFRQMDGSITRIHQGFGLGLSLVKELTLSLEGEVQLTSEVGKGSTFTVILPYMPILEVLN
jgi:signal transduction histidine kinase